MAAAAPVAPHPVRFDVDYPERQSRWKTLFRIPLAVPAFLFATFALYAAYLALFLMWLAILVRGRIPRWLFDFEVGVARFEARFWSYVSLLTDVYPAWDGDYPVRYDVVYPERVSRRQVVLWKFIAGLPQWIVVTVLQYAAFAVISVGWLSILFTGRFPKGLHSFVVGVMRWRERVYAYSISLTDAYPPYSLSADAPPTRGRAYVASSAAGVLATGGLVAAFVAAIIATPFDGEERVVQVSYDRLLAGDIVPGETVVEVDGIAVELAGAVDPADDLVALIEPRPGQRLIMFSFRLTNDRGRFRTIYADDFHVVDTGDVSRDPVLAVVGRRSPPLSILSGQTVGADLIFEVPEILRPLELSYGGGFLSDSVVYRLR